MATSHLNPSQSVARAELEEFTVPELAQFLEKIGYCIEHHWSGVDLLADDDPDAISYQVLKDGTAITDFDFNTFEDALAHALNLVMNNWTERSWQMLHDFRRPLVSE